LTRAPDGRAGQMNNDELNARLVAAINYLQDRLREGPRKLSVADLAKLLNAFAKSEVFPKNKLYLFKRGQHIPKQIEQQEWIETIEKFSKSKSLEVSSIRDLTARFIEKYGGGASDSFALLEGDSIDHPEVLCGAWRFFYISPVNRHLDPKPEIRGVLAIFKEIPENKKHVSVRMISGSTHWSGYAFSFNRHLYIVCAAEKSETAFFVVNKPTREDPDFVAGLGSALERGRTTMHPAMGVLCFGEKCFGQIQSKSTSLPPEVTKCLSEITGGQRSISTQDEELMRGQFIVTYYTLKQFAAKNKDLAEYLADHVTVHNKPMSMLSLFLQWR